jgi:NAD(P)-dependent dehydrogenase (short-subunit alcohol dehydrogenase family)
LVWTTSFAGAQVVVCDVNEAGGQETIAQITAAGGQAIFVRTDVSKGADVQAAIAAAEATYGQLNGLFSNAGIFHGDDNSVLDTDEAMWI